MHIRSGRAMRLLLMGNPNAGKSSFFSRLTGLNVTISNYPGTTVEIKKGKMKLHGTLVDVIDVPGTYNLEPTCKAEKVAVDIIQPDDVIINIIDSTNLERNLYLTLQLLEKNIPIIIAMNFWNETRHNGINIDIKQLEKELNVPVIPTSAITGEGVKKLVSRLDEATPGTISYSDEERWGEIGEIVKKAQNIHYKKHTILEKLEDLSIKPSTGIPIAFFIIALMFTIVRSVSEGLISYIFDPIFDLYLPIVEIFSAFLGQGFLHTILIGTLFDGNIDYIQSMGLLTTGIYVPIAMVLPYIFGFYLALGLLEDSGYLPRLATLVDTLLHKLGMHGVAIVPMMLGLGCNVPGALAVRILNTPRQRFIASTLMAITVPCAAQMAMIFGLLGKYGIQGIATVFSTLFLTWLIIGLLLNKFMKGTTPETFIEIPPYRLPYMKGVIKKLWMRTLSFITSGLPFVLLGVLTVNILYVSGIVSYVAAITAPIITGILGLPQEAVGAMIVGFLRKDVAIGMLIPLGLTLKQLIIASVVLTMYFPCVATFIVLFKELGTKGIIKSVGIMILSTLIVGGILNFVL